MVTNRIQSNSDVPLPKELEHLGELIAELPDEHRGKLQAAYREVVDSTKRRRRIIALLQESLAVIRVEIKSLIFDRDCTRKELEKLREQQEE